MKQYQLHLKAKGYKATGNHAAFGRYVFRICCGNIRTAMGIQKSYWLEPDHTV